jgi:hypothetical protein
LPAPLVHWQGPSFFSRRKPHRIFFTVMKGLFPLPPQLVVLTGDISLLPTHTRSRYKLS